jgi:hypothetical protein
MTLNAYWLGDSIVAATSPDEAVAVLLNHEPHGYTAEQARLLSDKRLAKPVDDSSPVTVAEELARSGQSRLIRWHYRF